jgi:sugar O-acyltransferase (sialic acid O-acetyltransferase NeuD family)
MRLLIYGSQIYARLLCEQVRAVGHELVGNIDDFNSGGQVLGSYERVRQEYPPDSYGLVIGIGYKYFDERWAIYQRATGDGYVCPSLVHPEAYVATTATLLPGSVVMARAIIDHRVTAGELSVIWPGANVSHDSVVGRNTFVSPGAVLCGRVEVGHSVFVGAGAIIADNVRVGSNRFIRAGEVVGPKSQPSVRVTRPSGK